MKCKNCNLKLIVIDSREQPDNTVMRIRKCSACHSRYKTFETIYGEPAKIEKVKKPMKDVLGKEVQVGDLVAFSFYPDSHGKVSVSPVLQIGRKVVLVEYKLFTGRIEKVWLESDNFVLLNG